MKLRSIENEASLVNEPTASDLDAASRLGPTINNHLTSLEALCKLMPDCGLLLGKLKDLRADFTSKIQLQSNVLESPITPNQQTPNQQTPKQPPNQQALNQKQKGVGNLENKLKDMAKGTSKLDYSTIDTTMKQISQQDRVTPNDLHKQFVDTHNGMTPDAYAQAVRNHKINEDIAILFDELSESYGNTIWVAITKRLTKQGYDKDQIKESVDRAINRLS